MPLLQQLLNPLEPRKGFCIQHCKVAHKQQETFQRTIVTKEFALTSVH